MGQLRREDLDDDPFREFGKWFSKAHECGLEDPNAMALATASKAGDIAARMVLLKYWDAEGFVFYTNYGSRKSRHLEENPSAALLFYWEPLHRQLRIEGTVSRVSAAESLKYFASRPRGSQLGAWSSNQSSAIASRAVLENKLAEIKQKFLNKEIPLPSLWGGFRVAAKRFEFWQAGDDRLHDRFTYELQPDGRWQLQRLAP